MGLQKLSLADLITLKTNPCWHGDNCKSKVPATETPPELVSFLQELSADTRDNTRDIHLQIADAEKELARRRNHSENI